MFKRTFIACIILASSSSTVFARGVPYVGGSLGAASMYFGWSSHYWPSSTVGVAGLFGGYGTTVGESKNIYLGGELNLDVVHGYGSTGVLPGLSFIPGVMVTQDTMIYGRLGIYTELPMHNRVYFETQTGVGVQTKLSKHWDFRAEVDHIYAFTNEAKVGLVYKFD